MLRKIREEDYELDEPRHDTELTLGPVMLLGIFCGLVLLCGLCFGLGYTAGRRSAPRAAATVTQTSTGQTVTAQAGSSLSKPLAKGTIPVQQAQSAPVPTPQPAPDDGTPSGNPLTSYSPVGGNSAAPAGQQAVHPALPAQGGAQPAQSAASSGSAVMPAIAPGGQIMVQVAAVSRAEDANVLMNALRRRGYPVMERRGFADNLIHVQIGPFANRNDANAMSNKLLGDGYNAVVLP